MFSGAVIKLRDARTAMGRLSALVTPPVVSNVRIISGAPGLQGDPVGTGNPVAFAEVFSSCVAQIRSVGDAVLKDNEANKLPGFDSWRELKKTECKNDDLLRFINDRRNDDLHAGYSPLTFTMHPFSFSSSSIRAVPSPTAALLIDGTGPYWLVDQGTPRERQVPCETLEGIVFTVAIANPPATHQGSVFAATDPLTLLCLGEEYQANLLFEARSRFVP